MNTSTRNSVTGRPLLAGLLFSLLAGCATTADQKGSLLPSIEQSMDTPAAAPPSAPPPEVSAALIAPPETLLPPVSRPPEPRFDIALNNAEANHFFMGLVEDTPYNIIVHPDVTGTLSLDLKNVTVDEVMQSVRDVYGYEYRKQGNVYQVLPARMRSRIYKVDYLNIRRMGNSSMKVSSGQVSDSTSSSSSAAGGAATTETTTSQSVSGSEVNTQSDADFWSELKIALESLIGEENGRKVVVNPQAGVVVVRAMPGELRDVEDYLNTIQGIIERQVILEAKIIEVQLNDGFQAGVNWAAFGEPGDGKSIVAGQLGADNIFKNGVSDLEDTTINLQKNANFSDEIITSNNFGGMFLLGIGANDFTALIELLSTQGDVQVLSSPRVSTVNNQKAVIKVGTDEFFVTGIETDTDTTGDTVNRNVDVEITPFFSGVALDVIPQIDEYGGVTLHIHPTVSEVTEKNKSIAISSTDNLTIPLALSSIRESDAIIRAKSGQIVVIGGLMKEQLTDNQAKTPFLGDLPGVGNLFRHKQQSSRKSELVILLKPIVTNGVDSWQDYMRESATRIKTLTR